MPRRFRRYFGWYSNKIWGQRKKQTADEGSSEDVELDDSMLPSRKAARMRWRRMGATYQMPEGEKEREAYAKTPPQELLTWPRLCNLRAGVLLAQEELDKQVLAKMTETEKGPGA